MIKSPPILSSRRPDPAHTGWNAYAYADNNPVAESDPSGLDSGYCAAEFGSCGGDGGGSDGGTDANGIPWNFGPGYVMTRMSGLSQINAGLLIYLNSIPWYSVQGGDLWLQTSSGWSFITNSDFDPDVPLSNFGSMVATENIFDLGSVASAFGSSSSLAANNGTTPSAANNVQQRLQQITNHLKNCGGVYPLTAAVAGTFKVDSSLPSNIYAVTSQNDQLYSQTSINPNTFGNANPSTQTGVVVHEWFHTTQIDDNPFFTFMNGLSQKLPSWLGGGFMENQANAAAKQALQTCGPG